MRKLSGSFQTPIYSSTVNTLPNISPATMNRKDMTSPVEAEPAGIEVKNDVRLKCDRCGGKFYGSYTAIDGELFSTEGFLHATEPFWDDFIDQEESILCARCIERDEALFGLCSGAVAFDGGG